MSLNRSLSVDNFQRVSPARPHARRAQKGAQGAHVAPLPADDFAHVRFGNFQFDHVVVEMIDEDLVGASTIHFAICSTRARTSAVGSVMGSSHDDAVESRLLNFSAASCYAAGTAGAAGGFEKSLPTRSDICAPFETQ